ncbi:hypothetical protein PsYK624_122320 [Phanerochaete sordida]|uniref:DNA polymerase epsilon subunit D n=1 Tax=Phanerochaete sordida TaxID=48140 RepID=A0A9P3LIU5_9APHY|nr:hypothetical protein PsYK624_122320 [Phanerochaete sordida]
MPRKDTGSAPLVTAQAQQDAGTDGIDAYELPKSLVTKIARSALPDSAKLQKETVLALMKGSTVFINYLAATAHDVALQKQHKSVSASDVLKALELLDLGDMTPKLQQELKAYRAHQKTDRRRGAKGKAKDTSESASAKGKGKAKAPAAPTITVPARNAPTEDAMDDQPESAPVLGVDDEDEEMLEGDLQDEDDVDDEEDGGDDEEDEGEELVDEAALEDEELRRDARGVDDRGDVDEED